MFLTTTLMLLSSLLPLAAQDASPADFKLGRDYLELLTRQDREGLLERLNAEQFVDEGVMRGEYTRRWSDLDETSRDRLLRAEVGRWIRHDSSAYRSQRFSNVQIASDPDAGRGVVPSRRYLRVHSYAPGRDDRREVLLRLNQEDQLIGLQFGQAHGATDAAGDAAGLQPPPMPSVGSLELHWPAEVGRSDKKDLRLWVSDLLNPETDGRRLDAYNELFSWPHGAVPALLEQVLAWHAGQADAPVDPSLSALTLEQLTGRRLELSGDRTTIDLELGGWLAWVQKHGEDFEPEELPDEIAEAIDAYWNGEPVDTARWEEALTRTDDPVQAEADQLAAPVEEAEPIPLPFAPIARPYGTQPLAEAGGTPDLPAELGGRPSSRALDPALAELKVLHDGEKTTYAAIRSELDDGRRERIEQWTPQMNAVGLRLAIGKQPGHLVYGRDKEFDDDDLLEATEILDQCAVLLADLLPPVGTAQLAPTIFFLVDRDLPRDEKDFRAIVDLLLEKRVLFDVAAESLFDDFGGMTMRGYPFVIQHTWDLVGNAAQGDAEFSLENELAHKFAVCRLTNRSGQIPSGFRWALGHMAEIAVTESVFQFNRSGFVKVDDHHRWPKKAIKLLQKRGRKPDFSLAQYVVDAGRFDPLTDNVIMTWAILDVLCRDQPDHWNDMVRRFAESQREADPYGMQGDWTVDPRETQKLLEELLAELDAPTMIASLEARDD